MLVTNAVQGMNFRDVSVSFFTSALGETPAIGAVSDARELPRLAPVSKEGAIAPVSAGGSRGRPRVDALSVLGGRGSDGGGRRLASPGVSASLRERPHHECGLPRDRRGITRKARPQHRTTGGGGKRARPQCPSPPSPCGRAFCAGPARTPDTLVAVLGHERIRGICSACPNSAISSLNGARPALRRRFALASCGRRIGLTRLQVVAARELPDDLRELVYGIYLFAHHAPPRRYATYPAARAHAGGGALAASYGEEPLSFALTQRALLRDSARGPAATSSRENRPARPISGCSSGRWPRMATRLLPASP